MISSVYRPKRKKNGKTVAGRVYRARIRMSPADKLIDVSLGTNDKQTAQKLLADMVRELNQERAGIIPSKAARSSAQTLLASHIDDFLASRESLGRCDKYVRILRKQLERLFSGCGWRLAADITADSFERWRSTQSNGPKTLNEYLGAATVFLNWMENCSRIPSNPLAKVQRAETRGRQKRERRALTETELGRLVAVSGPRAAVYLTAVYTGLRRGEIEKLQWADMRRDGESRYLAVRASTTKNKRPVNIPLHPDAASALDRIKPDGVSPAAKVFRGLVPRMPRFRKDLEAAGIAYSDTRGFADFHSLRVTFATWLTLNGASQRETMELMRHSDMRLTAKVYTDAGLLPVGKAMLRLPSLLADSQIDSQKLVPDCPAASASVQAGRNAIAAQVVDSKPGGLQSAGVVPECPSGEMVRAAGFEPATPSV